MLIHITPEECMAAVSVAAVQMIRREGKNRRTDHGGVSSRGKRLRWADGVHGCLAELAVCKAMRCLWTPGGSDISKGEVGGVVEVRATEHQNGNLLIYPSDDDGSWFVLAVGHYPEFRIAGCIRGRDAKRFPLNAASDPPCHWVPQDELSPVGIIDLKEIA